MLPMTRSLQTVGIDMVEAMDGVDNLISSLQSMRSEECFSRLFTEASAVATTILNIDLVKPRTASRSVYRPAAAHALGDSEEDYYRINVYFPTLDKVVQDIKMRFGARQQQAMQISRVVPAFMGFEEGDEERQWNELRDAVEDHKDKFEDSEVIIKSEFTLWRKRWQRVAADDRPKTTVSALDHSSQFRNIPLLLQLLGTFPITTAEAERVFSKMERTLSAIRSTMEERRFEPLVMLQIHRDLTPNIPNIIDHFAASAARRLKFVL